MTFGEHGFQAVTHKSNVRQLLYNGHKRIIECTVTLTSNQRIAPFFKDTVLDLPSLSVFR